MDPCAVIDFDTIKVLKIIGNLDMLIQVFKNLVLPWTC